MLVGTEAELRRLAGRLTAEKTAIESKRGQYDGTEDVAALSFRLPPRGPGYDRNWT